MGLLGKIVEKAYTKVLDPFTTAVAHPIKSVQAVISKDKKFKDVVAATVAEPKAQQITEVITTGLTVGSLFGAAKAVATKGVVAAGKALIPSTTKGKVTAAIAAPITIGVLSETKKPLDVVAKAPGALAAFGADVGTFVDDPTLQNAEKILRENPGVSVALGAGAVAAGAGALVTGFGAIENIKTRESVQDLTKTLTIMPLQPDKGISLTPVGESNTGVMSPVTPQTQAQATNSRPGGVRRRYKKRKSSTLPTSINQKVNVVVQNRNSSVGIRQSKNYIKERLLAR